MAGASLAIVVAACGGSITADEYVEDLNALGATGRSDFEAATDTCSAFLSREIEIRREAAVPVDALDPPELLTDVHELLVEMSTRQLAAAEGLLPVAQAVNSFDELQGTAELAEYEAANRLGSRVCLEEALAPVIDLGWAETRPVVSFGEIMGRVTDSG